MTINHFSQRPGISLNRDGKTASALVWAPFAGTVIVEKNSASRIALSQSAGGFWEGHELPLAAGDRYQIILDNKNLPDPASLSQPNGVHAPSEVVDLFQHQWTDQNWSGIMPDQLIIYELHVGTFSKKGTFEGVLQHLDRIKNLGVNTIELMPVAQFSGTRNWGYDGVFPFAVQNSYGGAHKLQYLVNECHKKGIAVILDVVYNHLGPEGNHLQKFGPYFTTKYKTPWGEALNFDDAYSDGVRHFFLENAKMWLRDFHIDGLRLDAAHAIKDLGAHHFLAELKEQVQNLNLAENRNHFLIAECDLNDVRYINPFKKGGYNLDAQWCDEFHHALHALTTGEENGYYSDFGGTGPLEKSYNHAFVYDGIYSPHRKKIFGSNTKGQPGYKFVVFAQNHDQTGNRMMGERLTQLVSFEMQKLIAAAYILSPFTPMLFMGEEYGEHHPFLYFVSHSDPELIRNVQKGRKKEFKDFMTEKEPPDPQSEETFQKSILTSPEKWTLAQQKLYGWYRFLIRFRKEQPFWQGDARKNFKATTISNKLIKLTYRNATTALVCFGNFSKEAASAPQSGKIIESSASEKFGGFIETSTITTRTSRVKLPPESFTIFKIS